MWMDIWNEKENIKLGEVNIICSPETFVILETKGISQAEAENILQNQLEDTPYYDKEDEILEYLHLTHNKYLFGRMDEVKVLLALLKYFKKDNTPYAVYPQKFELLAFVMYDEKFDHAYFIYPRDVYPKEPYV